MAKAIPAGSDIRILNATVVLADGQHLQTCDPLELATNLAIAYDGEKAALTEGSRKRVTGYQVLILNVEVGDRRAVWVHQPDTLWMWGKLGNPDLSMNGHDSGCPEGSREGWVRLPCHNGEEFAKFFKQLGDPGYVVGFMPKRLDRPGPLAHEVFVTLALQPDPERKVLAVGKVGLFGSDNLAQTYRWLYEMEMVDPDEPDWGRGDHVGNYTVMSRSFGP